MTKNFATRALLIVGLMIAGTLASFAQTYTAQVRRVAFGKENLQPVAASAVALGSQLNLTSDQRAAISAFGAQALSLQQERSRLWSEYYAVISRPDFDDDMSAAEAAPRMLRIVDINNQLAAMASRTDAQLNAILTPAQRSQVSTLVDGFRAAMAR